PVLIDIPKGITIEAPNPTTLDVKGIDRQLVGEFCAPIRATRQPEPYKGKTIRFAGEQIRRKAGKSMGTGKGGATTMDHNSELKRSRARKARSVYRGIHRNPDRPRLCVFRSNRYIFAQVIDDTRGHTVAAASSIEKELNSPAEGGKGKVGIATRVGLAIAERAKKAGVEKVVFDRRHYRYHGRVKALADGARKGGLSF